MKTDHLISLIRALWECRGVISHADEKRLKKECRDAIASLLTTRKTGKDTYITGPDNVRLVSQDDIDTLREFVDALMDGWVGGYDELEKAEREGNCHGHAKMCDDAYEVFHRLQDE